MQHCIFPAGLAPPRLVQITLRWQVGYKGAQSNPGCSCVALSISFALPMYKSPYLREHCHDPQKNYKLSMFQGHSQSRLLSFEWQKDTTHLAETQATLSARSKTNLFKIWTTLFKCSMQLKAKVSSGKAESVKCKCKASGNIQQRPVLSPGSNSAEQHNWRNSVLF